MHWNRFHYSMKADDISFVLNTMKFFLVYINLYSKKIKLRVKMNKIKFFPTIIKCFTHPMFSGIIG